MVWKKTISISCDFLWMCTIFITHICNCVTGTRLMNYKWAGARDFQQCGMCDQQSLRSAWAYAQSDQSLCLSLEYSMTLRLLIEHHLEFLSLKGGCTCSCESTFVKIPHCWKSHVTAQVLLKDVRAVVNSRLLVWWHQLQYYTYTTRKPTWLLRLLNLLFNCVLGVGIIFRDLKCTSLLIISNCLPFIWNNRPH